MGDSPMKPFRKEDIMKKEIMNYKTLLKVTHGSVLSRDPEETTLLIVEAVKSGLDVKGCALFLFNRKTHELEVAASMGLSDEYLNKGPLSAIRSIASSLKDGPVAVSDVTDDPRIQYPEAAKKEGIHRFFCANRYTGKPIGALRVYSTTPWEATLEDINFVQAVAQIAGNVSRDVPPLQRTEGQYRDIEGEAGSKDLAIQGVDSL